MSNKEITLPSNELFKFAKPTDTPKYSMTYKDNQYNCNSLREISGITGKSTKSLHRIINNKLKSEDKKKEIMQELQIKRNYKNQNELKSEEPKTVKLLITG